MTNLSSLSKIQYINIFSLFIFAISLIFTIAIHGLHWVEFLTIFNFVLAWFIFMNARKARRVINSVIDAMADIENGILERRIVNSDSKGELRFLCDGMNNMLDQLEVYMRDAFAVVDALSNDKYYRVMQTSGLRGLYGKSAENINVSVAKMQENHRALELSDIDGKLAVVARSSSGLDIIQQSLVYNIEELAHISEITEQTANESTKTVADLNIVTENLNQLTEIIGSSNEAINALGVRANELNYIVKLIKDI